MTHPLPEELAAFLYHELPPARQTEVAAHLDACPDCSTQLAAWRHTQKELHAWQLPETRLAPSRSSDAPRFIRWSAAAIAASLFLAAGFTLARLTTPTPDLSTLRTQLSEQLHSDLQQQFATEFSRYASAQTARDQDFRQNLTQAVQQATTRQMLEQASLRKDVETVALHTQEEFTRLASTESPDAPAREGNN